MLDKYRSNFEALTEDGAALLREALLRRYPDDIQPDEPDVFDAAARAGLDQGDVVLSLARDCTPLGVSVLETVVGKPILRGRPRLSGSPQARRARSSAPRPKVDGGPKRVRVGSADPRVVVEVAPNPKKPGSKSHERYEIWRVGATVAEMLAEGLTKADLAWDIDRGFVKLGDPK